MHNNGLEGKNGAIKFLATDFKQMSIPDFCNSISKFIQAESLEKDEKSNNFRPYKREPEIKSLTYTAVSMAVYNKSYSVYQTGLDDDRKIYALSRREGADTALAKQPNAPLLTMASESTDPSWANTGHSQIVGSNDTCSAADSTASATATGVESFEI